MKKKISFIKQRCLRTIQIQHEVNLIKLLPKTIDLGEGSHEKSDNGRLMTWFLITGTSLSRSEICSGTDCVSR
jgi:hypothetical protein